MAVARRRLSHLRAGYRRHEINIPEITQSVRSWIGHLLHGDTWRLRRGSKNGACHSGSCAAVRGTTMEGTVAPPVGVLW
jgi:hypothetical protein